MLSGSLKYLFVLGLTGLVFLIMPKKGTYIERMLFVLPWLFYAMYGLLLGTWNHSITGQSLKQVMFYLIPFMLAFTISAYVKDRDIFLDCQFFATAAVYLIWTLRAPTSESQYAFIFGIYFIYYFYQRRYVLDIVAFALLFYADKRIVLLVSFACVGYLIGMRILKRESWQRNITLIAYDVLVVIMFGYVAIIKNGLFLKLTNLYQINTMGRDNVYTLMGKFYTFSPAYLGAGIGTVSEMVKSLEYNAYQLLHNDILSFYIEIGFWGFLCFWFLYRIVIHKIAKTLDGYGFVFVVTVLFYTFLVYTTDNISIYLNYCYTLYIMIFMMMIEHPKENKTKIEVEGSGKTR